VVGWPPWGTGIAIWEWAGREIREQFRVELFATVQMVISETLSRKKGGWLEMTAPTTVQWWAFIITEDYGSKGTNV
jgi:hypothetical protein